MADETQGCLDCTRSFCLENNLPVCKDAEDVDVSATCYRTFTMFILLISRENGRINGIIRARFGKR